ncbi:GNAT family N-acetyltransferase [Cellulophaga sp. 20_2_10]|uniref:GNAT family N-acetyltransferase n=1 Tax=Cellulophaga sp. 20_2_10 TaxID=2942476 RepID=UPI00201AE30E|nr:GNAT family N-acetyltransferase [Cellulophaga sp. 20_2_10]MCL5244928.1 GNAT family N-acetyltransferase [Cellulophaga sp. 20_2_10]
MTPKIIEITSEETLNIRHRTMWPNKPINYVKLENHDQGRHFGLFIDGKMVSVISLFITNKAAQFRKFATLTEYQGKGYGTILLNRIISIAEDEKLNKIWCNARTDKSDYYAKFGMILTKNRFKKGEIEYVVMKKNIS